MSEGEQLETTAHIVEYGNFANTIALHQYLASFRNVCKIYLGLPVSYTATGTEVDPETGKVSCYFVALSFTGKRVKKAQLQELRRVVTQAYLIQVIISQVRRHKQPTLYFKLSPDEQGDLPSCNKTTSELLNGRGDRSTIIETSTLASSATKEFPSQQEVQALFKAKKRGGRNV